MIVLRRRKGGRARRWSTASRVEGTFRAHQVPLAGAAHNPEHLRAAGRVDAELSARGAVRRERRAARRRSRARARGARRMGANPHANGGLLLRDLGCRTSATTPSTVPRPARSSARHARARRVPAGRHAGSTTTPRNFRIFGPDETRVEPARRRVRGRRRDSGWPRPKPDDERLAPMAASWRCSASTVPGLARGVPPDRAARPLQQLRGLHPHRRFDVQPAREVAEGDA